MSESTPVGALTQAHAATFYENDNSSDTTYSDQIANAPTPLTLFDALIPAFSNAGFHFIGWNTVANGSGTNYSDGQTYDFSVGPIDLFAQWQPNSVTFYENANGSDTIHAVESGTTALPLTLFADLSPALSNPGYTFAGWSTTATGTGSSYANGATYDFTAGSLNLFAQWSAASYTVTFNAGGGAVSPSASVFTTGSSPVTLPTPTRTGYSFAGWYTASSGGVLVGGAGDAYTPTQSLTLYAKWSATSTLVTLDANGGTVTTSSLVYTAGGPALSLPTPSRGGYSFNGWYSAATGGTLVAAGGASYTPSSSLTLYAQWSATAITVNLAGDGGTTTSPTLTYVPGSTALTLPTPFYPGFRFEGWYTAPAGGSLVGVGGASYTPTADVTLYAQWATSTVVLTFDPVGGSVNPSSVTASSGAPVTLPSPTRPGFDFSGWFTAPDGGTLVGLGGSVYAPAASGVLYAQWSVIPSIAVTFAGNGARGGVASLSGPAGQPLVLPGPGSLARDGFTFAGWNTAPDGSGTPYAAGSVLLSTSPVTLFAQWTARPPVRIALSLNGGRGAMAPLTSYSGGVVTLPGAPVRSRPGFTFRGWSTSSRGSGPVYPAGSTLTVGVVETLYAVWTGSPTARMVAPVGPFAASSAAVSTTLARQVSRLAASVVAQGVTRVSLYGFAPASAASRVRQLSAARAAAVAAVLRRDLARLHHGKVVVVSAGEGVGSGTVASRVEVVVR